MLFVVYKDEKEKKKNLEERKKDPTLLKCYFISTVERSNIEPCEDGKRPYTFSEKKINEARSQFMHVHTVSSIAKYIARLFVKCFHLILI